MNRKLYAALAILAAAAFPAFAGEYHSGANLECYDCHTPHFSMQHTWDNNNPVVANVPAPGGNWLGATGPNQYLLKAPANELCLACHDGQTFAPDVLGLNNNPSGLTQGRSAGALNDAATVGQGWDAYMGHTLESTVTPPGWNPAAVNAPLTWYNSATGLECVSCHAQHGPATSYRNLGSYALGGAASAARPTYIISTADNTTRDVWINLASYTAGSGVAGTFNPYYDYANIAYNRNDATVGTTKTSNRMDTFCGTCHGNFHGGPTDLNIGGTLESPNAYDKFIRHPTSQVTIGAAGAAGLGGHTNLADYTSGVYKVRVYASDQVGFTDASPGCVSCHKAHGNQNPFGLFFLAQVKAPATAAGPVTENGVYETGQIQNTATGQRNLCGQCHTQGNN